MEADVEDLPDDYAGTGAAFYTQQGRGMRVHSVYDRGGSEYSKRYSVSTRGPPLLEINLGARCDREKYDS